jgi:hypothetical protein
LIALGRFFGQVRLDRCQRLVPDDQNSDMPDPLDPRLQRIEGAALPRPATSLAGRLRRRPLDVRRPAVTDPVVRGCQRHADALQGSAQAQGLGLLARRLAIIMHAMLRDGTEFVAALAQRSLSRRPHRAPPGSDAPGGRRRFVTSGQSPANRAFNLAASHPAYPVKRPASAQLPGFFFMVGKRTKTFMVQGDLRQPLGTNTGHSPMAWRRRLPRPQAEAR